MQPTGFPRYSRCDLEGEAWGYYSPDEIESVTLQIACMGSDGILLASDTRMVEMTRARRTSRVSKIIELSEHKVFYGFAGDDCARLTGEDFEQRLTAGFDFQRIRDELQAHGNSRWKHEKEKLGSHWLDIDRRLTVVFYGLKRPQLWQLKITGQSHAFSCEDKAISGDPRNTAIFFSENYCSDPVQPGKLLTLNYLKRLAAHVILMGHERNSEQVEGLEIVTYRFGDCAPVRVGCEELEGLREFSRRLDSEIRARFAQEN